MVTVLCTISSSNASSNILDTFRVFIVERLKKINILTVCASMRATLKEELLSLGGYFFTIILSV